MATLQALQCSNCGAVIGLDQLDKCPYCGTKNFLKSGGGVDPLHSELNDAKIQEYISFFKNKVNSNPKDTNSLFAMGLFYLKLRNFELAQRNFKQAVDLSPMEPDMYYYYAISLIEGRAPKQLNHEDAKCIRQWVQTALRMEPKRKYLMLLAFIEQGAFIANGLQAERQPDALIAEALKIMPEANELEEIASYVRLTDEKNKKYFEQLSTGKKEDEEEYTLYYKGYTLNPYVCPSCGRRNTLDAYGNSGGLKCSDCGNAFPRPPFGRLDALVCKFPSPHDYDVTGEGISILCSDPPLARKAFFRNLWEPKKPQEIDKPFWPIGKSLVRLIWTALATIVCAIIAAFIGGFVDRDFKEVIPVKQEYQELYGNKGYGPKKRWQVMEELRADSIQAAQEDSAFLANTYLLGMGVNKEKIPLSQLETAPRPYNIYGVEKSWRGIVCVALLFLPLLIWILATIIRMISCSRERASIARLNKERAEQYEADMEAYQTRPSISDYAYYCTQFLGQGKVAGKGDPVTQALKAVDVDEKALPSKILFLNYFDYEDENGYPTVEPESVLDRIYYVIAIPQEEKLTIFVNYWDTTLDSVSSCDYRSLLYRNINSIQKNDEFLLISMVGGEEIDIKLPPYGRSNILHYQGECPKDGTCYSTTRTGNVVEFINSLEKLVSNFQKHS